MNNQRMTYNLGCIAAIVWESIRRKYRIALVVGNCLNDMPLTNKLIKDMNSNA